MRIPSLNGREARFYVRGGFAEVTPNETVVLAEYALPVEELSGDILRDEIAIAEQIYSQALDDEGRWRATDIVERLKSLEAEIAAAR
jgi:F-type H+-transporting ATPase subunit epsilon